MRAIIFAAGSDGEIHPHLGIGRELMARGHHVIFITTFDYADVARECGFEVLSFLGKEEKQDFLRSADGLGRMAKIKLYIRFLAGMAAKICELASSRLDEQSILVAPPFFYALAKLLHIRYGTPYVSTVLVPAHLYSLKSPPSFKSTQWYSSLPYSIRKPLFHAAEQLLIDPFFRMLLKKSCQGLGVSLPSRVVSEWWYSPQRVIGLFYDWFCPAPDDWPDKVILTGFPMFFPNAKNELSAGLSQFLETGPPPIVFNPGTETQNPRAFFEAALNAVEVLGVRGVFLTRFTDHLPKLPKTIWHETYTSLPLLLARARALVHHGGVGTIALALRAGVPQLVLPSWTDQLDNGQRVERIGCGLVEQSPLNAHALREKLEYLMASPQVQQACRSMQAMVEPGAVVRSRTSEIIEESFKVSRASTA
jgi:rhamnosyltransferase subunit B